MMHIEQAQIDITKYVIPRRGYHVRPAAGVKLICFHNFLFPRVVAVLLFWWLAGALVRPHHCHSSIKYPLCFYVCVNRRDADVQD